MASARSELGPTHWKEDDVVSHFSVPVRQPEDIIPHLAKGQEHWRKGYSAYELAMSWLGASGFPPSVRAVLETSAAFRDATFVDAFFEREVELRTRGRPSQTDLMVVASSPSGLAAIAVEGKVEEAFGPMVSEWQDSPGKEARLRSLCETLDLGEARAGKLRYQLLHRTASAIYEAQRYGSEMALMLVHSFSTRDSWFNDFAAFADALGMPIQAPGDITEPKRLEGVQLSLGWVKDLPVGSERT